MRWSMIMRPSSSAGPRGRICLSAGGRDGTVRTMKPKPTTSGARGPALRIGEVAVCGSCLRVAFERAETASRRCRCGGAIIAMPKSEVDARRRDRR